MNILFIDEKDWVKKVPYTINYIAEGLKKLGNDVHVIDYDDTWSRCSILDIQSQRIEKLYSKIYPNTNINIISPSFVKIGGLSRISTLYTHFTEIKNQILKNDIDIIVTYAYMSSPQTIYLSKKYNVPLVFHYIDVASQLVPYKFLRKPVDIAEKTLFRYSDVVFALTPSLAERAKKFGANNVKVICNGVDINKIRPDLDCDKLKNQLDINKENIILFVGTVHDHTGIEHFLYSVQHILKKYNLKFLLVGGGRGFDNKAFDKLKKIQEQLNLGEKVMLVGTQPKDSIPCYINLADVCVSTYPPSKFSELNIPMKIFEYMAGGKPSISFELTGTKSIIPEGNGVIYVGSFEEMVEKIEYLLLDKQVAREIGERGRKFVESNYSWDSICEQFNNELRAIISAKESS